MAYADTRTGGNQGHWRSDDVHEIGLHVTRAPESE